MFIISESIQIIKVAWKLLSHMVSFVLLLHIYLMIIVLNKMKNIHLIVCIIALKMKPAVVLKYILLFSVFGFIVILTNIHLLFCLKWFISDNAPETVL